MTYRPTLLFVDDEPHILDGLQRLLVDHDEWNLRFASSVDDARQLLQESEIDVLITDVRMPGKDGFVLLRAMQSDGRLRQIPVIILTGLTDESHKRNALEWGATDLLNKPVQRGDLVARVRSTLRLKQAQDALRSRATQLEGLVQERTTELQDARLDIIWCLARAAEQRDGITGFHALRVAAYSRVIAQTLGLDQEFVDLITLTAPLHDVGKIGIPDHVLRKPGPLSESDWRTMKEHCAIGSEILNPGAGQDDLFSLWRGPLLGPTAAERSSSVDALSPMLQMASTLAFTHHERWDGSGYPQGLAGTAIPIESRIVSIADVYDALRARRSYKQAYSEERALRIISEGCGTHFDPEVFAAFERCQPEIRAVFEEYSDSLGYAA